MLTAVDKAGCRSESKSKSKTRTRLRRPRATRVAPARLRQPRGRVTPRQAAGGLGRRAAGTAARAAAAAWAAAAWARRSRTRDRGLAWSASGPSRTARSSRSPARPRRPPARPRSQRDLCGERQGAQASATRRARSGACGTPPAASRRSSHGVLAALLHPTKKLLAGLVSTTYSYYYI